MSAPYSYYDATLLKIMGRVANSDLTRKDIAGRLGWSTGKLSRKLSGDTMLTVQDIARLSKALGCKMSELVA